MFFICGTFLKKRLSLFRRLRISIFKAWTFKFPLLFLERRPQKTNSYIKNRRAQKPAAPSLNKIISNNSRVEPIHFGGARTKSCSHPACIIYVARMKCVILKAHLINLKGYLQGSTTSRLETVPETARRPTPAMTLSRDISRVSLNFIYRISLVELSLCI